MEPRNYNLYDNPTESHCFGYNTCMEEQEHIRYEITKGF